MPQWEYCQLVNPDKGTDGVYFSRKQPVEFLRAARERLQRGLHARDSRAEFLHLNPNAMNSVTVAGFLGQHGWDLVSHAVLTGGHEYWTFKRLIAVE